MSRRHLETACLLGPALVVLALLFVVPLARLFSLAFTDPAGPFATFGILAESSVYRQVMWNTFVVAVVVTVLCALLAWPVGYVLSRLKGVWFAVALYGVLFPFWISVLVRTFAWMMLLERNGPINRLLMSTGLTDAPLALLFNNVGVLIGMIHILLPYMILPLYGAMIRIDRRLLLASDGLGAGLLDTFRRIYFPLCLPGLAGGATFVFLLSLGFFITPALLGGSNAITLSMLIASFVNDRLAWSLAAAGSMALLAIVLVLMALTARLLPMEKGFFAPMNRLPLFLRIAANAGASLVLAFLVLPILAVVPASFNKASFIYLPPRAWSDIWYERFLADPEWRTSLFNSVEVATLATVIAVVIGTLAAIGLRRIDGRLRTLVTGLFLAPMIVPVIVTAVALYRSALDVGLSGTILGMSLSHALLALPFVVINVGIALRAVDGNWLKAAAGLGAGPWTIFRTVTLPNIVPGIVGGAIFSFITSFDEVIVAVFMAGYSSKTLPVKIWESIRLEFTPVIAVAATVMIALAIVLFALAQIASSKAGGQTR